MTHIEYPADKQESSPVESLDNALIERFGDMINAAAGQLEILGARTFDERTLEVRGITFGKYAEEEIMFVHKSTGPKDMASSVHGGAISYTHTGETDRSENEKRSFFYTNELDDSPIWHRRQWPLSANGVLRKLSQNWPANIDQEPIERLLLETAPADEQSRPHDIAPLRILDMLEMLALSTGSGDVEVETTWRYHDIAIDATTGSLEEATVDFTIGDIDNGDIRNCDIDIKTSTIYNGERCILKLHVSHTAPGNDLLLTASAVEPKTGKVHELPITDGSATYETVNYFVSKLIAEKTA